MSAMNHLSNRRRWLSLAALCSTLTGANVALAANFFRDDATLEWTATSGSGDGYYLTHTPSANAGLYGIRVAETADRPQQINFTNNLLTSGASQYLGGEHLQIFNGANGFQDATLPGDRFVTAVQVCDHDRRIKGVRLWGRRLDSAGLPTGDTVVREFKRTNCASKDWAEKVSCPDGKVAVGARANYYGNLPGSKTTFSGITLQCAALK